MQKYVEMQIPMIRPGMINLLVGNDQESMLIRTDALSRSSGDRRTTVASGMVQLIAGLEASAESYE